MDNSTQTAQAMADRINNTAALAEIGVKATVLEHETKGTEVRIGLHGPRVGQIRFYCDCWLAEQRCPITKEVGAQWPVTNVDGAPQHVRHMVGAGTKSMVKMIRHVAMVMMVKELIGKAAAQADAESAAEVA